MLNFALPRRQSLLNARVGVRLDESGQSRLDALSERLSVAGSVAPNSFFALNHGAFSSAVGAMINYLLVLIAFKVDE